MHNNKMENQLDAITCWPDTKIYIYCPAGNATGGPEALHQLAYHLNELGFNAYMYYYHTPDSEGIIHENYKKFQIPYVSELENKRQHLMVIPETYLFPIFKSKFSQIRKAIWWLSVSNYYKTQKPGINEPVPKSFLNFWKPIFGRKTASFTTLKQSGVLNIAHSHYSLVHLREQGIEPIGQLSDYMNDAFFAQAKTVASKEDIIIYNPKKNDEFLSEIMSSYSAPQWKPLIGLTPDEVASWMQRAKLYIDFGYHPGKERMPREACIMKCCMIIGKTGSAVYAEDMPIPEKYRFEKDKEQIPAIIACMEDCLANYNKLIDDFRPYMQDIYREKTVFINGIKKLFLKKQ